MAKTIKNIDKPKTLDLYNSDREDFYKRMSEEQKVMFNSIKDNIFTFCESLSGTGKTTVTVNALLDLLAEGKISKIIYIQKPSERYLSQGFLPGDLTAKEQYLYTPFYDALHELGFFDSAIEEMENNGMIQCVSDVALRGVNLKNVGVAVDEIENCDYHTLKLIFTRCNDDCRVVAIGDSRQKDTKGPNTDFISFCNYLANKPFGNKVELTRNYRGAFSQAAEKFIFEG